jgi:hypothetical protein
MADENLCQLRTLFTPDGTLVCRAGRARDGRAALFGECLGELVTVVFANDGDLLEVRQLVLDPDPRADPPAVPPWPQAPATVRAGWADELGLRDEPIAVRPFKAWRHHIELVRDLNRAVPLDPAKWTAPRLHHALWWGREYWLDADGHLLRVARNNPDDATYDVVVQLRADDSPASAADRARFAEAFTQVEWFFRENHVGAVTDPRSGPGMVIRSVDGLPGPHWTEAANQLHAALGQRSLLDRVRVFLVAHHRFADGEEDTGYQVLWPKDYRGEISLSHWCR